MPDGSAIERTIEMARETLSGDLRDYLLEYEKHDSDPLPWSARSEAKQRDAVRRAERFAEELLESLVDIVAAEGRASITCTLKKVEQTEKGIQVVLTTPYTDEAWLTFGKAKNLSVVQSDMTSLRGERNPGSAHVQRDQGSLLEGEGSADDGDEPVFDQTTAGTKAGGKPPKAQEAPAPAPAAKEGEELWREVADQVAKVMEFEELEFDAALAEVQQARGIELDADGIEAVETFCGQHDGEEVAQSQDAEDDDDGDDDDDDGEEADDDAPPANEDPPPDDIDDDLSDET